jgi:tripartite-type tricarboxylate transporter receptor subunit TctC
MLKLLTLTVFFGFFSNLVLAQNSPNWPNKPVRVIVAGTGGSATDMVARMFTEPLSKTFGQAFIIDNRAGANGMIATEAAAKAAPDQHTLLVTYAAAHVVNPVLLPKVPYDVRKDFTPVAQIGSGGNLLVVPASMPVKDLSEFIAYVKGKPSGSLSYGSWGNGSGGHLSMEALLQKTGLKMTHVPYKAVTASLTDLGGGLLQAAFAPMATVSPMIQAGRFKAIAVSGPYRVPQLPDVRTMTEQGVPFDLEAYFAFIAPSSMSKEVVSRLNLEINRLLFAPEMQEKIKSLGFSAIPRRTPEEFASRIEKDLQEWGAIVKSSNITVD